MSTIYGTNGTITITDKELGVTSTFKTLGWTSGTTIGITGHYVAPLQIPAPSPTIMARKIERMARLMRRHLLN